MDGARPFRGHDVLAILPVNTLATKEDTMSKTLKDCLKDTLDEMRATPDRLKRVSVGVWQIDQLMIERANLTIIAGLSHVGLTSLALSYAFAAASMGKHVAIVTEIAQADVARRAIAWDGAIDMASLYMRDLEHMTTDETARFVLGVNRTLPWADRIVVLGRDDIEQIEPCGFDLVVVDPMQPMAEHAWFLADYPVPVLATCSRMKFGRGEINPEDVPGYEHAGIVLTLRRHDPEDPQAVRASVAKNRYGERCSFTMWHNPKRMAFHGADHAEGAA